MAENFACRLDETARRHSEKVALVWDGGAMSWAELDRRARGFAGRLARRGIREGDRIAISLPNGWPFVVTLLAGLKLGATVAPLNHLLTRAERERIIADLCPRCIVAEVPDDERDGGAEDGDVVTPAAVTAPALILYTSGSTGAPKGAIVSHTALGWANRSWVDAILRLTPDDTVLGVLPFCHSYGLNGALLAPLLAGSTIALLDRFAPDIVARALLTHRVTVFPGVATMFRRLLDSGELPAASSLRLVVSGAAPCPWPLAEEWRERTGLRILRGYGMTELFRPISYLDGDSIERPHAIGRAAPGVELRIADDAGRPLAPGEVGELWIKTPAAIDGYVNAPAETDGVLVDGWFRTGDLACVSADGLVEIVGRKKEVILRGGYSVSPPEVERVLLSHPAVAEAAVVGRAHPSLGEEVVAFVSLRDAPPAVAEDLLAYCRERLAPYKCPRQVRILRSLPRTETGKVMKVRLTEVDG